MLTTQQQIDVHGVKCQAPHLRLDRRTRFPPVAALTRLMDSSNAVASGIIVGFLIDIMEIEVHLLQVRGHVCESTHEVSEEDTMHQL
jgi:hypothetical protein